MIYHENDGINELSTNINNTTSVKCIPLDNNKNDFFIQQKVGRKTIVGKYQNGIGIFPAVNTTEDLDSTERK